MPDDDGFATTADLTAAVAAFAAARDRPAARAAASEVALIAVPDAVAVSPLAGGVAAALRRAVEEATPWLADALAVLVAVQDAAHVWHALAAGTRSYRGGYDRQLGWERAVREALDGFDRLVRDLVVHSDPETRSMACLLLARLSPEPGADAELVRLVLDGEAVPAARACAAEAVLLLDRRSGDPAGAAALLTDQAPGARFRVAGLVVPHGDEPAAAGPEEIAAARAVIASGAPSFDEWRWPAEEF